jgi:hypothetical protein
MPVILSRHDEAGWVKSSAHLSDVLCLLSPYPAEKMNAYPVSEMVNIQHVNDQTMLNPIGDKLQTEFNPARVTGGYHNHKTKSDSGRTMADRMPPQSS